MLEAEFIKTLSVEAPGEDHEYTDYITLEIYQDPHTGKYFALDTDFLQDNNNLIVVSPYSRVQLRVLS